MSIDVMCPHCGRKWAVDDELGGKKVRCRCEQSVRVPDAQQRQMPPPGVKTEPIGEDSVDEQWNYARAGKQSGPVSAAELKQMASDGDLSPTDLVWKEGMTNWVPADKLNGLFTYTLDASASPPPQIDQEAGVVPNRRAFAPRLPKTNRLVDYLTFRRMIVPIMIQTLFWLGAILFIADGLYSIFDGLIPQDRRGQISQSNFFFLGHQSTAPSDRSEAFKTVATTIGPTARTSDRDSKSSVSTSDGDSKTSARTRDLGKVAMGLLVMVLGPFLWRIMCELLVLFFRMNETLTEIDDNTKRSARRAKSG